MKKILNKKILIITTIVLIIIVGLILSSFLLSKVATIFMSMRNLNLTKEYNKSFTELQQNFFEKTSTPSYESGLKLIKRGNANIEVEKDKFYETLNKLITLASQFNGNLINSQIYEEDGKNSGYLTFMIPSKNFDNFLNRLNELGKVKNLSISTEDVSEEYFDLEGRLKILESQRTLLLSWLEKAKDIKDLLSIRSELQNIETEIEKIKGRMNYINYHSEYSEISVLLTEKSIGVPLWEKSEILKRILDGLTFAIKSIINSLLILIIFLAIIVPWVLFGYLLYFIIKKYFVKSTKNS